jgi:hypothetical protein
MLYTVIGATILLTNEKSVIKMKHLTITTQFLERLSKLIIILLIAINSSLVTAIYINYTLPEDEEVIIVNRYLNYPDKSVYDDSDIQLIVYGNVKHDRK